MIDGVFGGGTLSERVKNLLVVVLFLGLILVNLYVFVSPYLPKRIGLQVYVLPNFFSTEAFDELIASLRKDLGKITVKYSQITEAEIYHNLLLELVKDPERAPDVVMVYDADDLIPGSRERLTKLLPYFHSIEGSRVIRPNPGIPMGFAITRSSKNKDKALKLIDAITDNYYGLF